MWEVNMFTERELNQANLTKEEKMKCLATKKVKTYKGDYWTINSLLGNNWAWRFYLLGGREAGKSYATMRWCITQKLLHPDDFKFYWFRLTEASTRKLLMGGAQDFVDPDLRRKFGINLKSHGNTVYTYKEVSRVTKTGKIKTEHTDVKEFCRVMACSTFYNDKGVGYFDNEYKGTYLCVLDEMNREQSEKNNFDIVYNFSNQLENVLRSSKLSNVKVFMIGNTLEEASDLLANLNFIPEDFGRYKLKRKGAIVDYIKPNEKYLERRKNAVANQLMGSASTFTNELSQDRELLVNKRQKKTPTLILKFSKVSDDWFTLWNNRIIARYNKEEVKSYAMNRYLDCYFSPDFVDDITGLYDNRSLRFDNLATYKLFTKALKTYVRKK